MLSVVLLSTMSEARLALPQAKIPQVDQEDNKAFATGKTLPNIH